MIKVIGTVLIAFFLSACGSSSQNSTEKTIDTEKKSESTTQVAQEVSQKQETKSQTPKEESSTESQEKQSVEETTPPLKKDIFTLTTIDGKKLHVDEVPEGVIFQEHKGKVVFLLFFGFKCPPCLAEIPHLKALTNEKHEDLEIIAMEVQGLDPESLQYFKEDKGINYTLLSAEEKGNGPFISYIGQRAQWGGSIPFLVAIDPKGEVKFVQVGGLSGRQLKTIYQQLSKIK